MIDFATRAHNLNLPFNAALRSLLDSDFYKLTMGQLIWEHFPNVQTSWSVINRTKTVRLADDIDIEELRRQLDYARTLRFKPKELVWLQGQTFYGQTNIFKPGYINALRIFKLPEYELSHDKETGQFVLTFAGDWWRTSMWEIYALRIINTLRSRAILKRFSKSQLDIIYARAKVKLYAKLERLAELPSLNISDFGTRRAHDYVWQEYCVLMARDVLGDRFTGTSNMHIAMEHGLEAKGSSAHELPMVFAALAVAKSGRDPEALIQSQYDVLKCLQNQYKDNMLVGLPDTFGSTQFFKRAPQWTANWKGYRPDSKEPEIAGEEVIAFYHSKGLTTEQVEKKLALFADGLDVEIDGKANGHDIPTIQRQYEGRIMPGFGWGTNLTNDFIGCAPGEDPDALKSISIVCKVTHANGHPCVKLSDNPSKAMGPPDEVAFYLKTFGTAGMTAHETRV